MKTLYPLLALVLVSPVLGDEAVQPPRITGMTPPSEAAPFTLTEAQLTRIVDDTVTRTIARMQSAPAQASYQSGTPMVQSSPQSTTYAAPPPAVTYSAPPVAQPHYTQVLVPPPFHKRAIAAMGRGMERCGARLAALDAPVTRTYQLATVQQTVLQQVPMASSQSQTFTTTTTRACLP